MKIFGMVQRHLILGYDDNCSVGAGSCARPHHCPEKGRAQGPRSFTHLGLSGNIRITGNKLGKKLNIEHRLTNNEYRSWLTPLLKNRKLLEDLAIIRRSWLPKFTNKSQFVNRCSIFDIQRPHRVRFVTRILV